MSGKYNDVQTVLKEKKIKNCVLSSCGNHTLNLVSTDCAEACNETVAYFGTVQKMYDIFSSSSQRWEILKENLTGSLHKTLKTRRSARIDCVRPIALAFG